MATGDVIVSISVEGGVTKNVALTSDIRVKAKAHSITSAMLGIDLSVDANWQILLINDFAGRIVSKANQKAIQDAMPTPLTFTEAS